MANEIQVHYEDGSNLYALVRRPLDGYIWDVGHSQFEAVGSWNDTRVNECDIALTAYGGELYAASFPVAPTGRYIVMVYLRLGTSPSVNDELIGSNQIRWSGNGELTEDKILINKAIQNKLNGEIDYYDDDSQTVILTHTPSDTESTITRMPS